MKFVTNGLVIRQTKVGESDAILHILTGGRGVISASAKGCLGLKNKLFSACGLFCYSEFALREGRNTFFIEEAQVKNTFFGIRQTVEGTALAMYLAEIAAILAPTGEEADQQLRLLLNSLFLISQNKTSLRQIKTVYELRTLCGCGYMPDIVCCKECGRYDGMPFYFNTQNGELLCESCAQEKGLSANLDEPALTALRHIALVEDKKIFSFTLRPKSLNMVSSAVEKYLQSCLDKVPRSLEFLNTVLPEEADPVQNT